MGAFLNSAGIVTQGAVTLSDGSVRQVKNSFTYVANAPLIPISSLALATVFDAQVWSVVAPLLSTDYRGFAYDVYIPARYTPHTPVLRLTGQNGTHVGDRLPITQCVNVYLTTGFRGRKYTGRKMFGPIAEADTLRDELTAAAAALWTLALPKFSMILTDFTGRSWTPTLESRVDTSANPNPLMIVGEVVTGARLNKTLGQCRHRRQKTER